MIKEKDVVWPIRMPKSLKDKFKNYCDSKGYSMNKLIKILIEKEITNE
jgi:predicted DNA-binding protein